MKEKAASFKGVFQRPVSAFYGFNFPYYDALVNNPPRQITDGKVYFWLDYTTPPRWSLEEMGSSDGWVDFDRYEVINGTYYWQTVVKFYGHCSGACTDADHDGYYADGDPCGPVDCNDNDPTIHPYAPELCDGKDNNCNGQVDEPKYQDADGDGFMIQIEGCPVSGIYDCDDNDPTIHPNAPEVCGDQKDNNCNGQIDESCKRNRCMEAPM